MGAALRVELSPMVYETIALTVTPHRTVALIIAAQAPVCQCEAALAGL